MEELGRLVRRLREERGWSQGQLAMRAQVDKSEISHIERGTRKHVSARVVRSLARAFRQPEELFLIAAGYLDAGPQVDMTPVGATVRIPVLGEVRAGLPLFAEQHIEEWKEVPASLVGDGTYFFLRVRGDSMEPTFQEGGYLLVRAEPDVDDGKVAVVMVGDEATVKRGYKRDSHVILKADNPAYPVQIVSDCEVRVLGVVTQYWRDVH